MDHLKETGMSYFKHLFRAWKISFVLFVHGIFPDIWKTKASDMLCERKNNSTYKHLMKHYGIEIEE